MKIYIATADSPVNSYDIDAVDTCPARARMACERAVTAARKKAGLGPWPYMDDIQVLGPLEVGKVYLDLGRAGEVK